MYHKAQPHRATAMYTPETPMPQLQITTSTIETSVGNVMVKDFTYTDNMRYTALYLLFTYFWTSEFIVAVGQVSILSLGL